jgi:hypothetical protein
MYSLVKTVCGFIFGFVGSFLARTGQGRVQNHLRTVIAVINGSCVFFVASAVTVGKMGRSLGSGGGGVEGVPTGLQEMSGESVDEFGRLEAAVVGSGFGRSV